MFSKLDMKSAYFQIKLQEDSHDLMCFVTSDGLFRFCRVPFSPASVPVAFTQMMDEVLGLPGVHHYFDHVVVSGQNLKELDTLSCYGNGYLREVYN